ncbi:homeobox domain-containing protein [Endozoicomonas atrinae]|uniref:homeobox domain-containing protein n=1 Tax=Endozoicomonas atrinae TaxID=1333660 RepID=UPI003AFFA33F
MLRGIWSWGLWLDSRFEKCVRVSSDSGQPASSEMLKREADTNELCSQQTDLQQRGRKIRTNFPVWKVQELNKAFAQHNCYISGADRSRLASSLQMTDEQVKV